MTMKLMYEGRVVEPGEPVCVSSANRKRTMGIWRFSHMKNLGNLWRTSEVLYTPVFRNGKRVVHGYSCWWLPLREALQLPIRDEIDYSRYYGIFFPKGDRK